MLSRYPNVQEVQNQILWVHHSYELQGYRCRLYHRERYQGEYWERKEGMR